MQGQEGIFAGCQWVDVDGDRDEDLDYGGAALYHGAAREVVVDDSVVDIGVCRVLQDVHGDCTEVCGADPCVAGGQGTYLENFQPQGVSHYRFHDFAGDFAQIHSRHSGTLLCLVLSRAGARPAFRGRAVPDPVVEGG